MKDIQSTVGFLDFQPIWVIVIASRITPRPYSTVQRLVTQGLRAWVNRSCTVKSFMTAVTKVASHRQDGSDSDLGHELRLGSPDVCGGTKEAESLYPRPILATDSEYFDSGDFIFL